MPILHAPILEQAGFSIGSVTPEPVINCVARLDGFSQEWLLSDHITTLPTQDYIVRFKVRTTASGFFLIANKDDNTRLAVFNGRFFGLFNRAFDTSTINDGDEHVVEIVNSVSLQSCEVLMDSVVADTSSNQGFSFNSLGGKYLPETGVPPLEGVIYDFEYLVGGALSSSILLTNKEQGATQLAIVGSINAFMPNYSSDVWEEL